MFETCPVWLYLLALAILIAVLCLLLRPQKFPRRFHAHVTYVCDGDSVWVRTWYGRRIKLRLLGIDAPETKQPSGRVSRECLHWLIGDRGVEVMAINRDISGAMSVPFFSGAKMFACV